MNKSETIGALSAALSKLQGEIQNLHKDTQGYGYKYVELSSVLDVTRPLCAKYELSIVQLCCNTIEEYTVKPEVVGIETVLMHSSGEWISSAFFMPVQAGKGMSLAQAAGSVTTYCRRYALAAMLGIAQTDNDASVKEETLALDDTRIQLLKKLHFLISERRLEDKAIAWCEHFKVKYLDELSNEKVKQLITRIQESN